MEQAVAFGNGLRRSETCEKQVSLINVCVFYSVSHTHPRLTA